MYKDRFFTSEHELKRKKAILQQEKERKQTAIIANIKKQEEIAIPADEVTNKLSKLFGINEFKKFYAILKNEFIEEREIQSEELNLIRLSIIFHMLEILELIDWEKVPSININEYIAAAFMLALKNSSDIYKINNEVFAIYIGMELTQLNACEGDIMNLLKIEFPCYPSKALYDAYNKSIYQEHLKKRNASFIKQYHCPYPRKWDELRLIITDKASVVQGKILKSVVLDCGEHIEVYLQHLRNESSSTNKIDILIKCQKMLEDNSKSDKDKLLNFYDELNNKSNQKTLTANNNYWSLVFASISVIPGIILAIHAKWFSSKKVFDFWKSHGDILYKSLIPQDEVFKLVQRCSVQ